MSISLQTEEQTTFSNLIDSMDENYKMFEITFLFLETNLKFTAHSHIIFPKCKSLSELEKDESGNLIINFSIERQYFETFINLLYGNKMKIDFLELKSIYDFAKSINYSNLDKIKDTILLNINKLEYSIENNQMNILIELLNYFPKEEVLKNCKLSHLKRLKDLTEDLNLLRLIIDSIIEKYTIDNKS